MQRSCPQRHNWGGRTLNQGVSALVRSAQGDIWLADQLNAENPLERYAIFALRIDELYTKHNAELRMKLGQLFREGDTREEYLRKIRGELSRIIEKVEFMLSYDSNWIGVNHWIGTMMYVLSGIFDNKPHISSVECKSRCRTWMRSLHIIDFPHSRAWDTAGRYKALVESLMQDNGEDHRWTEYEDKLSCPALYTQWWNQLFELIIDAIYIHFPV